MSVPYKTPTAGMMGFRQPTSPSGLNLLQLLSQQIKPIPGTKEHYKQMQMLANAYKPTSLATYLFGFE